LPSAYRARAIPAYALFPVGSRFKSWMAPKYSATAGSSRALTCAPSPDVNLSDEAASSIAGQVAAGRFRSVDDALEAGVDALKQRSEVEQDWLEYAGQRFAQGRAAFARGEALETAPDEFMDDIDKELGLA